MHINRPRMFIGSSSEGLTIARALGQQLQDQLEITIWSSGLFGLGGGTLETLLQHAPRFDFAALVLTPDDMTMSRGADIQSPRDNVIFEAGMFMGTLGRYRTFIVFDGDEQIKIPSDLAGITLARFRGTRSDDNLFSAVDEACHQIRASVQRQGAVAPGVLARAVAGAHGRDDPERLRKTVWFMGSDTELGDAAKVFVDKLVPELCSRLISLNTRIVVGDSPMLRKIAVAFRSAMAGSSTFIPNPVVIEGNLRNVPAQTLFLDTVGQVPNIAIVIGGSKARGRVKEEYQNAVNAGIPVLTIGCIGGVAAELQSTVLGSAPVDSLIGRGLNTIDSGGLSKLIAEIIAAQN